MSWQRGPVRRDILARVSALAAVLCMGLALILSKSISILMPGEMTSVHAAIENCSGCHTKSGNGKLSWLHGLVAGDPLGDSKACLTCHKMPDTAFNAHGASKEALKQSTERLTKISAELAQSFQVRVQDTVFPAQALAGRELYCATCHQEHQGAAFNLSGLSNEQCRSCHVVKFDSFDGDHPKFENYPFKRRTRFIFDHAGHFGKHYPEVQKKEPAKRIPESCSTCHSSRDDKRIMSVAPFDKVCANCHLDQITGKERASGPKGIAFLSLPGLDLQTLKNKNAAIGEWPGASEAGLSPFMKVMISRSDKGRALLKSLDGLNLQDLNAANDEQIRSVTELVWEIKRLYFALISGKASDVLGNLNIRGGAKLSAALVTDLTASIPRDVVMSAQEQWLPNLANEIANGPDAILQQPTRVEPEKTAAAPDDRAADETDSQDEGLAEGDPDPKAENEPSAKERTVSGKTKLDRPPCSLSIFGQCLVTKGNDTESGTSKTETAVGSSDKRVPAVELPGRMNAGVKDAAQVSRPAEAQSPKKAADQADDLLILTDEERRELTARNKDAGKTSKAAATPVDQTNSAAAPAPVISIESGIDSESWAEYGGWYRQDYEIFYRPTGHKDKFIYSWLFLAGPQAPKGETSPVADVFQTLAGKESQGSCVKCHSIDDLQGKGRMVNFSPPSVERKEGRFTRFIHEPHFAQVEMRADGKDNRGCLTCHNIVAAGSAQSKGETAASAKTESETTVPDSEKSVSPYLQSYEHGDPKISASNFSPIKKDVCQTCHTASKARQDCLLCHNYHVNGVETPITSTKLPMR